MNRRITLLALAWAAAWCFAMPAASKADTLGRLFFTPEQRAQLEKRHARNMNLAVKKRVAAPQKKNRLASTEEVYSVLTVNGIVQKHGGPRTVWINGVPQNADSRGELAPDVHIVTAPGKAQAVPVKVGQQLLLKEPPQPRTARQKPATADNDND